MFKLYWILKSSHSQAYVSGANFIIFQTHAGEVEIVMNWNNEELGIWKCNFHPWKWQMNKIGGEMGWILQGIAQAQNMKNTFVTQIDQKGIFTKDNEGVSIT